MDREQAIARTHLGQFLRRARRLAGVTLETLASGLRSRGFTISSSTLSRAENGAASLPLEILFDLVRILGISAATLEAELRRTRVSVSLDLGGWNDLGLIDEGRRKAAAGDTAGALDFFLAARDWVLLQEDPGRRGDRLARCLLEEAEILRSLRNFPASWMALSRALNTAGLSRDMEARLLVCALRTSREAGDRYLAQLLFARAEKLAEQLEAASRAAVHSALGSFCLQDADYPRAMSFLRSAVRGFRTVGHKAEGAEAEICLGFCQYVAGGALGLRTMEKGTRRAWRGGAKDVEAGGWMHLAKIWAREGDTGRAEEAFHRVRRLARRLRATNLEQEAWNGLREIARQKGRTADVERAERMIGRLTVFSGGVPESKPEVSPWSSPPLPGM